MAPLGQGQGGFRLALKAVCRHEMVEAPKLPRQLACAGIVPPGSILETEGAVGHGARHGRLQAKVFPLGFGGTLGGSGDAIRVKGRCEAGAVSKVSQAIELGPGDGLLRLGTRGGSGREGRRIALVLKGREALVLKVRHQATDTASVLVLDGTQRA